MEDAKKQKKPLTMAERVDLAMKDKFYAESSEAVKGKDAVKSYADALKRGESRLAAATRKTPPKPVRAAPVEIDQEAKTLIRNERPVPPPLPKTAAANTNADAGDAQRLKDIAYGMSLWAKADAADVKPAASAPTAAVPFAVPSRPEQLLDAVDDEPATSRFSPRAVQKGAPAKIDPEKTPLITTAPDLLQRMREAQANVQKPAAIGTPKTRRRVAAVAAATTATAASAAASTQKPSLLTKLASTKMVKAVLATAASVALFVNANRQPTPAGAVEAAPFKAAVAAPRVEVPNIVPEDRPTSIVLGDTSWLKAAAPAKKAKHAFAAHAVKKPQVTKPAVVADNVIQTGNFKGMVDDKPHELGGGARILSAEAQEEFKKDPTKYGQVGHAPTVRVFSIPSSNPAP
jgi:hypothetical protein